MLIGLCILPGVVAWLLGAVPAGLLCWAALVGVSLLAERLDALLRWYERPPVPTGGIRDLLTSDEREMLDSFFRDGQPR